jgi:hypothetical protein
MHSSSSFPAVYSPNNARDPTVHHPEHTESAHHHEHVAGLAHQGHSVNGWPARSSSRRENLLVVPPPAHISSTNQYYTMYRTDFSADPRYLQGTTPYQTELVIDNEQASVAASGYQLRPETQNNGHFIQQPSHQYAVQQHPLGSSSAHQASPLGNGVHPLTTQRWSAEFSPEERLRLGFPRYESEEQRCAYERANYESPRSG